MKRSEVGSQKSAFKQVIYFFIGFIIFLLPTLHHAQTVFELPKVVGKFSAAHLLDPIQPAVHVALEHRLQERWYLQHQAGYLLKSYTNLNINQQNGFRVRSGIRHYVPSALTRNEKTFIEFSLSYAHSNIEMQDDFCRFDCAYFQNITYNRTQNIYTAAVDYGAATYFSQRFLVEFAISGGLRLENIRYINVPPDAALPQENFNILSYNPDETFIPIHFGIRLKLGYVLQ
ncbi:MAG: DUF3575 domain-containing protein [Saprospiraceae bacterium]